MKSITRFLGLLSFILLLMPSMQASHYKGGEVTYEYIGGFCQYRITVTEYLDCSGIVISPSQPSGAIKFYDASASLITPTALTAWSLVSDTEVINLSPAASVGGTSCNGGTILGVRKLVFEREYNLCGPTFPQKISLDACCRGGGAVNLAASGTQDFQYSTDIFQTPDPNKSPTWLDPSFTIIPAGFNTHRISMAANDEDGDSLVYSIDTVFTAPWVGANYNPSYSTTQAFGPNVSVYLESMTGNLNLSGIVPIGEYVLGLEVHEYRTGVLLSVSRRDFTIVAANLSTNLATENPIIPWFNLPAPTNGTSIDSVTVATSVGSSLVLPLSAETTLPGETIHMTWSNNIAGAQLVEMPSNVPTDTIISLNPQAEFRWTPTVPGRYTFNIKLRNDSQAVWSMSDVTYVIDVSGTAFLTVHITPGDTVQICDGDTVNLSFWVPNTIPFSYPFNWSNGQQTPSINVISPGIYYIGVFDVINNVTIYDTVVIEYSPYCIWPADADNDLIADNNDLLAIGLTYGDTGPLRPGATLNWEAQKGIAWMSYLPNGTNAVFTDTDGNGIVNDDDTLAINLNYGQTHLKGNTAMAGAGDPTLYLTTVNDSILAGDTLNIAINLGVDSLLADSIYGLAFTVQYNNTLVDSFTAHVSYHGWLGIYGTNMLGIQKDFFADGEIDVALVRTDQQIASGYGMIANLSIVMIDDIAGKTAVSEILDLDLIDVRMIGLDGEVIPVNTEGAQVVVTAIDANSIESELAKKIRVYPQPAQDLLFIELDEPQNWEAALYTLSGQRVSSISTLRGTQGSIDLSPLANGLYILRIKTNAGILSKKVMIAP